VANISINGKNLEVPNGITIIQACELAGIEIPRFCYHEKLAIAGNCRMCLVEVVGGPPKPVASCAMPVADNMQVFTESEMVKKAREGVMEFLLINHPLDCPICDQGGECDLQDQAYQYGKNISSFHECKRAVPDKNLGHLIKTQMNRCIHCTRCVRFFEEIAGSAEMGSINRGEGTEITTYLQQNITSELSGNIIDLCPVGALTSKPYSFKARSWELKKTETIDVMDAFGSNIRVDSRGLEVMRILPSNNEEINQEWISDKTRFSYDGLKYQRLNQCYIRNHEGKLIAINYDEACYEIAKKITETKSSSIGALAGNTLSLNEIFIFKHFLEKNSVKNFDCRLDGENIDSSTSQKPSADYLFNSQIVNIENADACLLVGVNIRKDAPLLNIRLRSAFAKKPKNIANIGFAYNLNYQVQELGNSLSILMSIFDGSHPFSKTLQQAKNPIIIFGSDLVKNKNAAIFIKILKYIAKKYKIITNNYNGFNFVAHSTGFINGLELDFATETTNNILQDSALILLNNVDKQHFSKLIATSNFINPYIIYFGSNGSYSTEIADLIIPTSAFSEKSQLYVNIEGRVQSSKKVIDPLLGVCDEIKIFTDIAKILDISLDFNNQEQVIQLMYKNYPHLSQINEVALRSHVLWQEIEKLDETSIISEINQMQNATNFNNKINDTLVEINKINNNAHNIELNNSILQSSVILNKLIK
jgi:NADH-quinone oxidoreductase subunit G